MNDIIIFALFAVNIGLILYIVTIVKKSQEKKPDIASELLLNQINELSRTVDSRIGQTEKSMKESVQTQFTESQRLMRDINEQVGKHLQQVTKEMTQANESSKQVFSMAEQLRDLEKVLKHQKQRGNLGEAALELILSNMLSPENYKLQYMFKDGSRPDAVIMVKEGIIPVDAKFSLDNYNRIVNEEDGERKAQLEKDFKNDLKKRIDETAKYIKIGEGTLPFAFMFIPAEAIYYDLMVNEVGSVKVNTRSLIDYAYNDKKVIIVSPTTFSAYLKSVIYGFKAFQIEEKAQLIAKKVSDLSKHLAAYEEYHGKLGKTIGTVVNHFNASRKELGKIDKDVTKITGDEALGLGGDVVEKPEEDE
jgi:DNA recombination protein RmuC